MKIGFDIDGVLADFNGSAQDFIDDKYPFTMNRMLFEFFSDYQFWMDLAPYPYARHVLWKLKRMGYEIYTISTRPEGKAQDATTSWLNLNLPKLIKDSYFDGKYKKAEIAKELKLDYFVEDRLLTAFDMAFKGIKVFLIDRKWNQSTELHSNILRVANLMEVLQVIRFLK